MNSHNSLKLLFAIGGSLAIHAGFLYYYQLGALERGHNAPFSLSISTNNYESAQTSTPIDPTSVLAGAAIETSKTVQAELAIPDTLATASTIAEDGLSVALDATAQTDTAEIPLASANIDDNLASLEIQDLLPGIASKNAHVVGIQFQAIPDPQAIELTALDSLENIPEISETSETRDLLAGIDAQFTSAVSQKLSQGLQRLKPKVEALGLEGKLRFLFIINRTGDLVQSSIVESSNSPKLDQLVLDMLAENAPYPQLPKAYASEFLRFSYPIQVQLK